MDLATHYSGAAPTGTLSNLVDVVPAHVTAAAGLPGVTAEIGDARHLASTPPGRPGSTASSKPPCVPHGSPNRTRTS